MIVRQKDFMKDIYEKYPHFTESCLDNICKKGMTRMNSFLKAGNELMIRTNPSEEEIKFFIPMSPEAQQIHSTRKYYNKLRRLERKNNEQKTGNK